jgi:hypothetical protein
MANRIRSIIESLVFAGLKPAGGVPAGPRPPRRLAWLRDKIERFLSGGRADDPLYLSNRTWKQKLRLWLVVGTPLVLLVGAATLFFTNVFTPQTPPPPKEPTNAEKLARLLPDLQNTVHIDALEGIGVDELRVLRDGPPKVTGLVTNKTDAAMSVDIDLELADRSGSRLGSVTQMVKNVPPHSSARFEFAAADPTAMYAIVKKIRRAE